MRVSVRGGEPVVIARRLEIHVSELAGLLEASGEQHWSYLLRSASRDLANDPDRALARLRTLVEGRGGLASVRLGEAPAGLMHDPAAQVRFEQLRATVCAELGTLRAHGAPRRRTSRR